MMPGYRFEIDGGGADLDRDLFDKPLAGGKDFVCSILKFTFYLPSCSHPLAKLPAKTGAVKISNANTRILIICFINNLVNMNWTIVGISHNRTNDGIPYVLI